MIIFQNIFSKDEKNFKKDFPKGPIYQITWILRIFFQRTDRSHFLKGLLNQNMDFKDIFTKDIGT